MSARRLVALLGAALFLLTGCRVDVYIDVTADDAGAGTISVTVDIDAEAVTLVPGLADDLRLDDLIASGWTVEGPTQVNSGGLRVVLRYAFESPAEATTAMNQINGPNGPLLNPALKRTVDGRTVSTTFDATLQLVGGVEAFSDSALSDLIGNTPWRSTAEKLGVVIDDSFSVTLSANLPGEIRKSTGTVADGGVIWNAPTDGSAQTIVLGTADTKVDGSVWKTISRVIGWVLGLWLILIGLLIVLVLFARRRRPNQSTTRTRTRATPDA
ncbi:MAG: hypothetical protein ACKOJ9_10305 [Actinomycetota bacterium]